MWASLPTLEVGFDEPLTARSGGGTVVFHVGVLSNARDSPGRDFLPLSDGEPALLFHASGHPRLCSLLGPAFVSRFVASALVPLLLCPSHDCLVEGPPQRRPGVVDVLRDHEDHPVHSLPAKALEIQLALHEEEGGTGNRVYTLLVTP